MSKRETRRTKAKISEVRSFDEYLRTYLPDESAPDQPELVAVIRLSHDRVFGVTASSGESNDYSFVRALSSGR